MKYIGSKNFDHGQTPRLGVLLTNLGTPEAPDSKVLRKYLRQFLWDPRVVEIPRPLWWLNIRMPEPDAKPSGAGTQGTGCWMAGTDKPAPARAR